jgi:hypothetical protein
MAIDNLNYMSSLLPAGQLTDKYSSQPWCLKSKNLDIFSSSKSVKATAWSTPTQWDADVIKQDWKLLLKTDWKVYERTNNWDVLVVDPSVNFPVNQVSYTWDEWPRENAQWGTVQDLVAKYEWDVLKSYTVFTDRASYTYSAVKYTPAKSFWWDTDRLRYDDIYAQWYRFTKSGSNAYADLTITLDNPQFSSMKIKIYATESSSTDSHISLEEYVLYRPLWYYYNAQMDSMDVTSQLATIEEIPVTWNILEW